MDTNGQVLVTVTVQFKMHGYDYHCDRAFIERIYRHITVPLTDDVVDVSVAVE